jgi:glycerol-3-phosphate acyltransferase PlsX
VVADGFTGNVVLKTSEALAHAVFAWLKHEIYKSPVYRLGGLLAKPAFQTIRRKTSADEYGGMPLLGVNGVCIIAHGGSSPVAVKNAIRMAADSIRHQVNPHIVEAVQRYHERSPAPHTATPA